MSVATDCNYAVEVPQLRARATAKRALARISLAEFEARACSGQVQIARVRGHSGDPCNELAHALADLGCGCEASHDALLSWVGDLRLPELTSMARF